jgi:hypothetical protein
MPLSLAIRMGQEIEVRQTFDSPTIYLDHWAIRRLSDEKNFQHRFVAALHKAGGTLFLSHQNFAEFVGSDDASHAVQAEQFLERVLPNIYFAQLDLNRAIAQEQDPRTSGHRLPPPPDLGLLKLIALRRLTGPQPFTVKGLLTEVATHRDRLGKTFHESNQRIADAVNAKRQKPEFVKKVKGFKADQDRARTLIVMEEILRSIVLDASMPFMNSDSADYQHAILSTSYCDYVLLDGKWQDMVRRMERRFSTLKLPLRHARCFSERRNGLESFLLELESHAPRQVQPA